MTTDSEPKNARWKDGSYLARHMRGRVYGCLPYWLDKWAATVRKWDPWAPKS